MTVLGSSYRKLAHAVALLMVTNLVVAGTAAESAHAATGPRADLRVDEPVEVTPVQSQAAPFVDPSAEQVWDGETPATSLPSPAKVVFDLDGDALSPVLAGETANGQVVDVPVAVTRPAYRPGVSRAATSGSVTVEIIDQKATRAAGVAGVMVKLTSAGKGPVRLAVDYRQFADLFGGGWSDRLRLVELPECAATTPELDGCLDVAPVPSDNDIGDRVVEAGIQLDEPGVDGTSSGRLFAVTASAASDGAGDYRATDLPAAGSWSAGGNDGAFTYGYPLRTPPAAGPSPSVSLGYSSAAHDGLTSGRNNQASWIGDGWGYEPGFIERSYKPCSLDDGGNTPDLTGDMCWDGDGANITMSLNGTNTTLVLDDSSGTWRSAADANWRIEQLGSPASNSAETSERWKVTTPDGTQYFFASEVSTSSSRWTVPVFGNHAGEPCRSSAFKDSSCRQAYRWLLDKVVDVHGNLVRYFYTTETGQYGAAADPDNRVAYHRSGRLERIEYGLRASDSSVPATGRIQFTTRNRCLGDCGTLSNPTESNWPDTPWDLHCDAAPCTSQLSPAFFGTQRLTKITTQVRDGSSYRDVDSWTLEHDFKDYGDEEQVTLWLKSIQHTGHIGADITLPKTQFGGEALPNRVDAAAGVPVMWRWRMASIKTEAGGVITVAYDPTECTPGNLPSASSNSKRCYPVRWTPEFFTEPVQDWFHKHVVSSVVETDTTGGGVAVETSYDYDTDGGGTPVLWAFDDSEFTEDEHRTYNQWRGYAQVTTRVGDPAQTQTQTRARFYRGLDGQPLPSGGTRSVSLTDSEDNTVTDHEALAGQVWESLSYNGPTIIAGSTSQFWTRRTATQSRDHDGGDLKAWLTGKSEEKTRTWLVGSTWQRTETRATFDSQGRATQVNALGDTASSGDELCTRMEYAENSTAWIKNAVKRSETVGVACGTTPSRPADVVSDTRTFFDGSNTHGAAPSKGLPTRVDTLDDWQSGPVYVTTARMTYDSLGRIGQASDALGRTSTTSYTPAGPGPVTATASTNPAGHVTTTELEPAWGTATGQVEPNSRRTDVTHDALGRTTAVWLPGRAKSTFSPSMQFEYHLRNDAPSAVTTKTLNAAQDYVTSIVLYDALLRPRQTQTETWDRGRLVTETIYDTQGRVEEEFGPNYNTSPPAPGSIVRAREDESARRIGYFYDAAGRVTDEVLYDKHVERWRTVTSYGGSADGLMVRVRPPEGAPATATITNARGETIEKRTYRSNTPSGAYDALSYEYSPSMRLDAMTDQAGNQWSWDYDLRGRQVEAVDPDAGTTTMTYDVAGQLTSSTDARGKTVVNAYDELGRQISRHDGNGTLLAEWQYDTAINGIGTLAKATRWVDGNPYVNEIRAVNPMGLVTQTAVSIPASEGALAGRYFFSQTYTANGQVNGEGLWGAGDLETAGLSWDYDHVGNPIELSYYGDVTELTVIVNEATFTPFNEVQTRLLGTSDTRFAHHGFQYENGTRRLERATMDRDASRDTVADIRYTYDDAGNILSIADVPEDLPGNHELQCFQYDQQRRLIEAWAQGNTTDCASSPSIAVLGGPAPYWNSYDHDVTGNRTSETLRAPGQTTASRSYTYPAAGQSRPHAVQQVTTAGTGEQMAFEYDQAGNTTSRDIDGDAQTLLWDTEGNLEAVEEEAGDTVRMVYDADGNRLIRDDGDTVTAYLPRTELTWDRATDTVDGVRYFDHAGDLVAICSGQDVADWVWIGADPNGTATHSLNAFTAVEQVRRFDPYGNERGPQPASWPGQQSFVGGVEDPTGLIHIGARSYDPAIGRFLSVDPILAIGDNQQINGYSYAHNNPITFTDPTGMLTACAGDAYNLCPGQDPRTQPAGKPKPPEPDNSECFMARVCGPQTGSGGTSPHVIGGGTEQHGTTRTVWSDGSVDINGWMLPAGAPSAAELAPLVDQVIHSNDWMTADDTYLAIAMLCDSGDIECDADFQIEVSHRSLAVDLEVGSYVEVLGAIAAMEYLAKMPALGGGRVPRIRIQSPAHVRWCRNNSFAPGTLVLMADGTYKPIENVEVGDMVLAADPETGVTEPQPVEDTITGGGDKTMVAVTIAIGTAPSAMIGGMTVPRGTPTGQWTASIIATDNHPFWVTSQEAWLEAGDLKSDHQLMDIDGSPVSVTAVAVRTQKLTVYNLTVPDIHTYYVVAGGAAVLVHNACDAAGLAHATDRHYWKGTRTTGKSQFFDQVDLGQLSNTSGRAGIRQPNGNVRYVIRGDGPVGVDRTTGLPTNTYTVIRRPNGDLVTMFPGTSPKG
jgi:RHS repeat-associated protein